MKFEKISITDYKGIADTLNINFTDDNGNLLNVIVFAGTNGSGKTSVLESCFLALKAYQFGLDHHKPINIRKGKDTSVINATIFTKERMVKSRKRLIRNFEKNREESVSSSHEWTPSDGSRFLNKPVVYFSSWRGPKLPEGIQLHADDDKNKIEKSEENRLYHIVNEIVNIVADRSFDSDYDPSKKDKADLILDKIREGWIVFYPDRLNDKFEAKKQDTKKRNIFLTKSVSNNNHSEHSIPIDSLSAGEMEIFLMLGWFAINNFDDGIVFIDEPELHMHPAWQRKIIPALQKVLPKTQLIVATHSPQVISSVKPESIRLLEHPDRIEFDNSKARHAKSPTASFGLDTNRILEDIMGIPEHPEEIQDQLDKLFNEIDRNNLAEAKSILDDLKQKIYEDPKLQKADTLIRLKENVKL